MTDDPAIAVRVRRADQLFDSLDPAPFHERDLDRNAHEYIVGFAQELSGRSPAKLIVYLDEPAGVPHEERVIAAAIRDYFARHAKLARRELRQLLRRGWMSLLIGLSVLAAALTAGELLEHRLGGRLGMVLGASMDIGGWVAMWAPMEIFLYDWWPIVGRRRIYERLSRMAVEVVHTGSPRAGAQAPAFDLEAARNLAVSTRDLERVTPKES